MIYLDLMGTPTSFQDTGTVYGLSVLDLHDRTMSIIFGIVMFVFLMLIFSLLSFFRVPRIFLSDILEFVWTLFPVLILYYIALYSIEMTYISDEALSPELTVCITGYQWYWTYFLSDFDISIESRLSDVVTLAKSKVHSLSIDELVGIKLSNLEVDNECILPVDTNIRLLVTSSDVIHSWTIPSWSVKVDAIPGRINGVTVNVTRPSVYYGQCSELCGILHGYMPVKVRCMDPIDFYRCATQ